MERGLTLFKDGEDSVKTEKTRVKKVKEADLESLSALGAPPQKIKKSQATAPRSVHQFTDNPWGSRARRSVKTTERLDARKWENIFNSACVYLEGKDVGFDLEDEESGDAPEENDLGMVDLSW